MQKYIAQDAFVAQQARWISFARARQMQG